MSVTKKLWLYHITHLTEWDASKKEGIYRADSLASQGFIHCSSQVQVVQTANRLYHGQTGLVLLQIDPERVHSEIRWENLEGGSELFPHIYGSLSTDAVIEVFDFTPQSDGSFKFPG